MFQIIRIFRIARKTSLKSLFLLENFLKKSSKSSLTYWLIAVSIDSQNSFFHYQICSLENMFRKYMVSHKKKLFSRGYLVRREQISMSHIFLVATTLYSFLTRFFKKRELWNVPIDKNS